MRSLIEGSTRRSSTSRPHDHEALGIPTTNNPFSPLSSLALFPGNLFNPGLIYWPRVRARRLVDAGMLYELLLLQRTRMS